MLGNSMKKYVISENKNGYSKQVQSVYNSRIKAYAKLALQDLALLAEKLPEDQQAEIFNDETVRKLFAAIIKLSPDQMTRLNDDEELAKKKRQRLLPLCYELIIMLNQYNLAHLLAPVGTRYMIKEGGKLAFLKAIYYRSLDSKDDEEP
jgi:hypothetical protein